MNKFNERMLTIIFDVLLVVVSWLGFQGQNGSPIEKAIWVLAALCFVRLGLVLKMLKEKDEAVKP